MRASSSAIREGSDVKSEYYEVMPDGALRLQ